MYDRELVERVWKAIHQKKNMEKLYASLKMAVEFAHTEGAIPFGIGNSKTQCFSTYRKVGDTCPKTCPYLNGDCYAMHGNTYIHQKRSNARVDSAVDATVSCFLLGTAYGRPVRMHVSGDFFYKGQLDIGYAENLENALQYAKKFVVALGKTPADVFTYSHANDEEIGELRDTLPSVEILHSDAWEPGGAVVYPHNQLAFAKKETGLKLVGCLSQSKGIHCSNCGICQKAVKKGLTVVFNPHGAREKRLLRNMKLEPWSA